MKALFILFIFLGSFNLAYSQFGFGTPLVPANVELTITITNEEHFDGKVGYISKITKIYTSKMNASILWKDIDFMLLARKKKHSMRGTKVISNNFITTFPEGVDLASLNWPKVAQYPLNFSKEVKIYGADPCDTYKGPGDEGFKPMLNRVESYRGIAKHDGKAEALFSCSITGIQNCDDYLFFNVSAGGAYFENGRINNVSVPGITKELTASYEGVGCQRKWEKRQSSDGVILEMYPDQADYSETPTANNAWIGKNGEYYRSEEVEEEGQTVRRREDLQLMKIDTASFFRFLREKPETQTFTASGNHYSMVESEGFMSSSNVTYALTITFGKQLDFEIDALSQEEYETWMPGHEDYPGTMLPLSFKAEFIDNTEEDTICFELQSNSHLPGICTNYPILGEDSPEEKPDIFFAPQDRQTDPNIIIFNDTVAKTSDKVNAASIVVYSRDFGGHAELVARSLTKGQTALCKADKVYNMEIPFDENGNLIADYWEEQMGAEGLDKNTDDDNLPAGIKDTGDGLTAFEEYRGFISLKDVIASCDKDRLLRNGFHIRTSPVCRDVFIHDPNALFSKYIAAENPAACHWHYLTREQLTLPNSSEIRSTIYAANIDDPPKNAHSPEDEATRAIIQEADNIKQNWARKEFRRINANSPERYRNNKQYALYLLESPLDTFATGLCIGTSDAGKYKRAPIAASHLIVIPKFSLVKKETLGLFETILRFWDHPVLREEYPMSVRLQLVQRVYEAMIPHEIGHGLGIEHHTQGRMNVVNLDENEYGLVNNTTLLKDGHYAEIFYWDGKEYGISMVGPALLALGVDECCMRYTTDRELDFITMRVLKPSVKFCKKGQRFTNADGNETEADDCFGSIKVKCDN
ncbi:MAG: hypothetical protein PF694_03395 [Bacteroidetes bacterium]|jgi:hypothetical protein|nr:hypothetical protein [Bacteroidota bacterium]